MAEGDCKPCIKVEVGRTVYYRQPASIPFGGARGPLAAKVVYVHGARMVNLTIFDSNGGSHALCSVELYGADEKLPPDDYPNGYAYWMPYQVEQAERMAELAAEKDRVEAVIRARFAEATKAGTMTRSESLKAECADKQEVKPFDPAVARDPATLLSPGKDCGPSSSWLKK